MLFEATNLSYAQEHKQVLKNVSLNIRQGQIISVLGANGSGKSTLLKLLAGLLDPDSGEILLEGKKILGPSYRLLPGYPEIALVKQDSRLFPFHTVRENLRHVLQSYNETFKEEKIEELSIVLDLGSNLDRKLKFLSGGEQQRVSIAAALAADPQILLMDEPFSQTDFNMKEQLKKYLFEVVKQLNISLLFVTHDAQDALSLADEVIILHEGGIIEQGTSEKLYYRPKTTHTAEFTGYASWLPVEMFPQYYHLHRVGDFYLLRPDQITISNYETNTSLKATVQRTEFCGFYQCLVLILEGSNIEIIATPISIFKVKIGDFVFITF